MSKPLVAVVGRPNVGKSTFFNKVVGRRVSIVEDTPGVTRDRIYAEAEWKGIHFALIDIKIHSARLFSPCFHLFKRLYQNLSLSVLWK